MFSSFWKKERRQEKIFKRAEDFGRIFLQPKKNPPIIRGRWKGFRGKKKYLYRVESEIVYRKSGITAKGKRWGGRQKYITYYGSNSPMDTAAIERKAKENIRKHHLKQSAGRVTKFAITAILR